MVFWLSAVGYGIPATLRDGLTPSPSNVLIPVGMFVFGVLLTVAGFFPEAKKARKLLDTALQS